MTRHKLKSQSLRLFLSNHLHEITEYELLTICQRLWDYKGLEMSLVLGKLNERRAALLLELSMIDHQIREAEALAKRPETPPPTYRFKCTCGVLFGGNASELRRFQDHRFIVHPGEAPKPLVKTTPPPTPKRTKEYTLDDIL